MIRSILISISINAFFLSCINNKEQKTSANRFKRGVFEIPESKYYPRITVIRKDSLQIEKYNQKIDTFIINWKNNFQYSTKYLNPKNQEQAQEIFHVQINKVKKKSYDFTIKMGNYSNFKIKGTMYKIQ